MLKDDVLADLVKQNYNVAQFFSLSPSGELRHCFIRDECPPNPSLDYLIDTLLEQVPSVNIRCFKPSGTSGLPFLYGLTSREMVKAHIEDFLRADDYYLIINETIDVNDGGVSGVILGDLVEFTPKDTPRGVEKSGSCSLSFRDACRLFDRVYDYRSLSHLRKNGHRVEFSIHPGPVGVLNQRHVTWEVSPSAESPTPRHAWPNNFSRLLGDKAYGLLLADLYGFNVPRTTVVPIDSVPPFAFGSVPDHQARHLYTRPAPSKPLPGQLDTTFGVNTQAALSDVAVESGGSVLIQTGIRPKWSGACQPGIETTHTIEGVKGEGGKFMLGAQAPEQLSSGEYSQIWATADLLTKHFGPVRFEWVIDPAGTVWIVQLQQAVTRSSHDVIVEGTVDEYITFDVSRGLEELRMVVQNLAPRQGIKLHGDVGVTSHLGDVLRRESVPSKIVR